MSGKVVSGKVGFHCPSHEINSFNGYLTRFDLISFTITAYTQQNADQVDFMEYFFQTGCVSFGYILDQDSVSELNSYSFKAENVCYVCRGISCLQVLIHYLFIEKKLIHN